MNFFDGWLALNSRFDEGDLTAQTQLVGYKLFAIFNERKFPESLVMTDRELQSRTNIKSGQTIVAARRSLKNAGLIDFESARAKATRYRLTIKQDSSKNQASFKQESSKRQASGLVSYTHVREDETEDVKTFITTTAGAREGGSEDEAAGLVSYAQNPETPELIAVLDYWDEELRGGRMTFEHQSKLEVYLQQYGGEWVKAAMKEASDANNNPHGMSPKYLFTVLKNKANPKATKGGERIEQPKSVGQPITDNPPAVIIPPALQGQYAEWIRKNATTA